MVTAGGIIEVEENAALRRREVSDPHPPLQKRWESMRVYPTIPIIVVFPLTELTIFSQFKDEPGDSAFVEQLSYGSSSLSGR